MKITISHPLAVILGVLLFFMLPLGIVFAQTNGDQDTDEKDAMGVMENKDAIHDGEDVYKDDDFISQDKDVDGDFFGGGSSVRVGSNVSGDVFAAGNTVSIAGVVEGNVFAVGNSVTIIGDVKGDVYVAASTVTITGPVDGKITVAAAQVSINSDVKKDVYVTGGVVDLDGRFADDVRIAGGMVTFNGTVTDDLYVKAGQFNKTTSSVIGGNETIKLDPTSATDKKDGDKKDDDKNAKVFDKDDSRKIFGVVTLVWLLKKFLSILGWTAVAFLVMKLFPHLTKKVTDGMGEARNWLLSGFLGFAIFLVAPFVSIILVLTLIGIPIVMFLSMLMILALILAAILSKVWVGKSLLESIGNRKASDFGAAFVGVLVVELLTVVPVLGWIFGALLTLVAFGLLTQYTYNSLFGKK